MFLEVTRESTNPITETLLISATSITCITQNLFPIHSDKSFCFQFQEVLVRKTNRI